MQYFQIAARRQSVAGHELQEPVSESAERRPKRWSGLRLFASCVIVGAGVWAYFLEQQKRPAGIDSSSVLEPSSAEGGKSNSEKESHQNAADARRRMDDERQKKEEEMRMRLAGSVELLRAGEKAWFDEKFVRIPGGDFQMGSSLEPNNAPHVAIVPEFWMDSTEVTFAEWKGVKDWAGEFGYVFSSEGSAQKPNCPVSDITWYDAARWCNAKSEMAGLRPCYYVGTARGYADVYRAGQIELTNEMVDWEADGYRLPTEAEWEKAARGGLSGRKFPNGDKLTSKEANHSLDSAGPRPVKSYPPNGFGLYEMAGNVWEWVWDWYSVDVTALVDDPRGATKGERRVIRGGGCSGSVDSCGVAVRVSLRADVSLNTGGFRIVRRPQDSGAR